MRDVDTTYAAKIFVQQLHVSVDDLECDQLIILILDGTAEIQACVSSTRRKKICINICDISSIKECIKTVKCIFGNKSQSQKKERSIDTKLKCLMSGPECDRKSMQRYHNPASVCRAFKNGQEVNAEIIHSQSFLLIHLFKCSVMQIFDQTITCYEYNTFRPVY